MARLKKRMSKRRRRKIITTITVPRGGVRL